MDVVAAHVKELISKHRPVLTSVLHAFETIVSDHAAIDDAILNLKNEIDAEALKYLKNQMSNKQEIELLNNLNENNRAWFAVERQKECDSAVSSIKKLLKELQENSHSKKKNGLSAVQVKQTLDKIYENITKFHREYLLIAILKELEKSTSVPSSLLEGSLQAKLKNANLASKESVMSTIKSILQENKDIEKMLSLLDKAIVDSLPQILESQKLKVEYFRKNHCVRQNEVDLIASDKRKIIMEKKRLDLAVIANNKDEMEISMSWLADMIILYATHVEELHIMDSV
jgi:hypothetical protein